MVATRTYTDADLARAVASSQTWADVAEAVGRPRDSSTFGLKRVAVRLGLDTNHLVRRRQNRIRHVEQVPADAYTRELFTARRGPSRCSGLAVVVRWFLERGYLVSLPVEPAPYDLVVESDDGLKRVQVKTASHLSETGRSEVLVVHHGGRVPGKPRRRVPYTADDIDLFFIIAGNRRYIIPVQATDGRRTLTLDVKYAQFRVD